MDVDHGGLDVLVVQQLLNSAEVLVLLQQVGVGDLAASSSREPSMPLWSSRLCPPGQN